MWILFIIQLEIKEKAWNPAVLLSILFWPFLVPLHVWVRKYRQNLKENNKKNNNFLSTSERYQKTHTKIMSWRPPGLKIGKSLLCLFCFTKSLHIFHEQGSKLEKLKKFFFFFFFFFLRLVQHFRLGRLKKVVFYNFFHLLQLF